MPSLGLALGLPYGRSAASYVGPLDDYTTDLALAFSASRQLITSYSGSALKVRRSGDNAESDFGFVNGAVNTSSMAAFCVAGGGTQHGFVTTWYDQTGNGRHLLQTTAANQPQIVTSGAVNTENSKPVMTFDGSNDRLEIAYSGGANFSAYFLSKLLAAGSFPMMLVLESGNVELRGDAATGNPQILGGGTPVTSSASAVGTYKQYSWVQSFPGTLNGWNDGTAFGTAGASLNFGMNSMAVGSRTGGTFVANENVGELLIYTAAHDTTTRQAIQTIQKNHFGTA